MRSPPHDGGGKSQTPSLGRGPRGERGEKGERGLSMLHGRAVVALFCISVSLSCFAIFWVSHAVNNNNATQARQSMVFEKKLCSTLIRLESNKPPPGNPSANPSRGYDQRNQKILSELAPDLDCK